MTFKNALLSSTIMYSSEIPFDLLVHFEFNHRMAGINYRHAQPLPKKPAMISFEDAVNNIRNNQGQTA